MAATVGVNKLLPVAVGVMFLALVGLVYKSASKESVPRSDYAGDLEAAPVPDAVDIDSPADTIKSLQGQIQLLQRDVEVTRQENDDLMVINSDLVQDRAKITEEFSQTLNKKFAEKEQNENQNESEIKKQLNELASGMDIFKNTIEGRVDNMEVPTMPVGLGLGQNNYRSGEVLNATEVTDVVWIQPLDQTGQIPATSDGLRSGSENLVLASGRSASNTPTSSSTNNDPSSAGTLGGNPLISNSGTGANTDTDLSNQSGLFDNNRGGSRGDIRVENESTGAYYTLPDLSVLANSTTLTALIGRVFIDDQITNPYPFKVVVGRDNITANQQELPSVIESMILEGFATGDWPLSCVRGTLTAATFVFNDGSIKSAYVGDEGTRPANGPFDPNALGYISDEWGNPCITGEPITDAPRFLAQRFLLAGAEGYAQALRAQNIDTIETVDTDGSISVTEAVTGNANDVGIASAYIGGIQETTAWLRDRQRQSFDAIYIRSGQRVAINLQQELRLDISEFARKINYTAGARTRANLD